MSTTVSIGLLESSALRCCLHPWLLLCFCVISVGCGSSYERQPELRRGNALNERTPAIGRADVELRSMIVQRDSVIASLRANQWFELHVPFRIENNSSALLGLPGCRAPNGPFIETRRDSTWHRWAQEYDLCDSPPQYVKPRSMRVDTLHRAGCYQRQQCSPAWIGDSTVTMRLVYRVFPTSVALTWSSEVSRLPYVELASKPFKAILRYRPCESRTPDRGLLC